MKCQKYFLFLLDIILFTNKTLKIMTKVTKRQLVEKQIELSKRVIALANINIVTCGNCGEVLLHDIMDNEIECAYCKHTLEISDCPDLFYADCEHNAEFNEE